MIKKLVFVVVVVGILLVYILTHHGKSNEDTSLEEGEEITLEKTQSSYDQSINESEHKEFITNNYTSEKPKVFRRSDTRSSSSNSETVSTSINQSKKNPNKIDLSSSTEVTKKIQELSRFIPTTHVQLATDNSSVLDLTLALNTLKQDTCHWGDLDIIAKDVGNSEILLSVEPILPSDDSLSPITEFTSLNVLEKGSFYFNLPRVSTPVFLGLYLCKDSSNSRRCNNKSFQSLNDLFLVQNSGVNVTNPKYTKDKIYFFQSFILTHNDIYILDNTKLNKNSQELKKTLLSITDLPEKKISTIIKRVKNINKNIRSENVSISKQTINLLLPKRSEVACKR